MAGFRSIDRGLRLSRHWCRRLVAASTDIARDLVRELGVPSERIVVIPPGLVPQDAHARTAGSWNVPVIGAGGPHEEASGLSVFLKAAHLILADGHDVEFVIASHTSRQIALRHTAQRLQIADRVTLADYPRAGPEFWSALNLYCQPAIKPSSGRRSSRRWPRPPIDRDRRERPARADRLRRERTARPPRRSSRPQESDRRTPR